jgi:hypothetical protein
MGYKRDYFLNENGNKVLSRNLRGQKIRGIILCLAFFGFGILLIASNLERTDFSSNLYKNLWGIFLICLSSLFLLIFLPLKMKITEYKEEFLIERVNPFWIKREFKISKKENPILLGAKQRRSGGDASIYLGKHLYTLRFSYNGNIINLVNLYFLFSPELWNTPEEIKEIADYFKLPYKLLDRRGNLIK